MKWNDEISKLAIRNLATDEWNSQIIEFVESLGDWMEAGNLYHDFLPEKNLNFNLEPDQLGFGIAMFISEWAGDVSKVINELSGLEMNILCYYVALQIHHQQQKAAQASHSGEADESLLDSESN